MALVRANQLIWMHSPPPRQDVAGRPLISRNFTLRHPHSLAMPTRLEAIHLYRQVWLLPQRSGQPHGDQPATFQQSMRNGNPRPMRFSTTVFAAAWLLVTLDYCRPKTTTSSPRNPSCSLELILGSFRASASVVLAQPSCQAASVISRSTQSTDPHGMWLPARAAFGRPPMQE